MLLLSFFVVVVYRLFVWFVFFIIYCRKMIPYHLSSFVYSGSFFKRQNGGGRELNWEQLFEKRFFCLFVCSYVMERGET